MSSSFTIITVLLLATLDLQLAAGETCFSRRIPGTPISRDICIEGVGQTRTSSQAEAYCAKNFGGHLVSITNQYENNLVVDACAAINPTGHCWIGLSDDGCIDNSAFNWQWSDGTENNYTYWDNGEPNSQHRECCTHLVLHGSHWNNIPCSSTNDMFVCEYDVTITTTTSTASTTVFSTSTPTPTEVVSTEPTSTEVVVPSSAPTTNCIDCSDKRNGNYPNPTNSCVPFFFMCSDGNCYKMNCANGFDGPTYYDAATQKCDIPSAEACNMA